MAATHIYPTSKTKEFIQKARNVHGNKYDYSLVDYKNAIEKVTIICPEHGEFEQKPNNHLNGQDCPKCGNKRKGESSKSNTKEFIEKAKKAHGNFYDYFLVEYKNAHTKVTIVCPKHGEFEQKPNVHLNGAGCTKCSGNKQPSTEDFIEKAKEIHDDFYDYSLVEYKNNATKITIICPVHGEFEQNPNNHLSGNGCLKCFNESSKLNTKEFIEKAKNVHNNFYDYSLVDYIFVTKKVTIICPVHGEFEQRADSHLDGQRCPECASKKSNTESFIEKAKNVHNNFYDYSFVDYKNALTKVTIICPYHGKFEQKPNNHLNGEGCPKCSHERRKGIFSKKFLEENPERAKENCTFYIIEIFNGEEGFIKCGITQRTIQERFRGMKDYNYKILDSFDTTLEKAINLEYYLDGDFEKYWPKKQFCGHTECFNIKEKENILQVEC